MSAAERDPLPVRSAMGVIAFGLLAFPASSHVGSLGVNGALVVALVAVALLLYDDLAPPGSVRGRNAAPAQPGGPPDTNPWRGKHVVQDHPQRGLEARAHWRRHEDAG